MILIKEVESASGTTASDNGEFTRMARMQRVGDVTGVLSMHQVSNSGRGKYMLRLIILI